MTQELVLTIGLPASGKTTWTNEMIRKNPEYVNVNRDDIRLMMQGRERYAKFSRWRESIVTATAMALVQEALAQGKSVIVSDTNLDPKRNENWKGIASEYNVEYREKLFTDVPLGVCLERDAKREYPVGGKVIMGMYERYRDIWWPKPEYNPSLKDCYIFDVDGTLAQMDGRGPFEWHKVDTDKARPAVVDIARTLAAAGETIIIVSGRDGSSRELTEKWLNENGISYTEFFIRPAGDNRKDYVIKEEIYRNHIKDRYNVKAVFDDRDQVVHVWRHLGLDCFQVNYGNF